MRRRIETRASRLDPGGVCIGHPSPTMCKRSRLGKEFAMAESLTVVWLGLIVLIMAVILITEHFRREPPRSHYLRWLDSHPMRDWLHHRP